MQNTYEYDLSESASKPLSKVAILKCKKSKKLAFRTMRKHFFLPFKVGVLYFLGLCLGCTVEKGMM